MSERRAQIIDSAKDLFAAQGYATTSMRDIALDCELLAGSLYSHFRSKAHILERVLLPFFDELIPGQRAALEAGATGAEGTEAMLRRVLAVCAHHAAELTILHYEWAHLAGLPELEEVVDRSHETLDLWEQALARGQADGSLRAEVAIPTAVRIITSSIHGVLDRRRFATLGPPADRDLDRLADEIVASLVAGLRTTVERV